ncbi:MAG: methyltransferase type 11, partial [Hyphomicrobium sp.]
DTTPFGQGLPFSRTQLERQLTDSLFTPMDWGEALYFPPFDKRLMLRMAPALERTGARLSFGVAGVIIVEARKEIMAPVGGGLKVEPVRVLRPAENVRGARRRTL